MRHPHLVILTCVALSGCFPAKFTEIPALSGRVVGFDGRPVPGAAVEISRKPGTPGKGFAKTLEVDSNGTFRYPGQQRWVLWIILADVFPEAAQVQARSGSATSTISDVEYQTEVIAFGVGKPRVHEVGELRLPTSASSP